MNNNKEHKKSAFTAAEAFVALAIISIVIAASIPMVTIKLKQGTPSDSDTATPAWGYSAENFGQGLITENPVVITSNLATSIDSCGGNCSLSYRLTENSAATNPPTYPSSLLNIIRSERPLFKVGSYNFSQMRNNIFITTSDIPNTYDKIYGSGSENTYFNNKNGALRNIFLGGKNYSDENSKNNIIDTVGITYRHNTIIGDANYDIKEDQDQNSLIVGFKNYPRNKTHITIVGYYNKMYGNINKDKVIIGNDIQSKDDYVSVDIGSDCKDETTTDHATGTTTTTRTCKEDALISYKQNTTTQQVIFNKPTIIDGVITANEIQIRSDKRLKNIKGDYEKGLAEVLKVEPILYTLKSDTTNDLQVGVVAQDLQKTFPEAVVTMPNGYLGVDVTPIFFATLNALKELSQKTQYEKERTKRLKAEYLALTGGQENEGFGGKIKAFFKKVKMKLAFK